MRQETGAGVNSGGTRRDAKFLAVAALSGTAAVIFWAAMSGVLFHPRKTGTGTNFGAATRRPA
jgi:hypothetical protein